MASLKVGKFFILALVGSLTFASGVHALDTRADESASEDRMVPRVEETVLRRIPSTFSDNTVIVAWSRKAYEIAFAEDQFLTFKGHRAFTMMHIAMHDALNAIVPVYRQYIRLRHHASANPIAAAAQAGHDVLASQYPNEQATLKMELDHWLSRVPEDGRRRARSRSADTRRLASWPRVLATAGTTKAPTASILNRASTGRLHPGTALCSSPAFDSRRLSG